jgi:DNA repair ATPase RecN
MNKAKIVKRLKALHKVVAKASEALKDDEGPDGGELVKFLRGLNEPLESEPLEEAAGTAEDLDELLAQAEEDLDTIEEKVDEILEALDEDDEEEDDEEEDEDDK